MKSERSYAKELLKNNLNELIVIFFIVLFYKNCGCVALNGDSSSMDNDQSSTDMMENDPNLLIIPNKQGYGKDIPNPIDLPSDKLTGILSCFTSYLIFMIRFLTMPFKTILIQFFSSFKRKFKNYEQ